VVPPAVTVESLFQIQVSRAAIERLAAHGPFFQSPYPDYYATNVFSIGATLDLEFLRLARSSVALQATDPAAVASFGTSASSLGFTATACAVVGFHF